MNTNSTFMVMVGTVKKCVSSEGWRIQWEFQSHLGKSHSPVAWIAGRKETEFLKPIDKAISRMVSKSPGRNVSEPVLRQK
jgi:hypothetical protein